MSIDAVALNSFEVEGPTRPSGISNHDAGKDGSVSEELLQKRLEAKNHVFHSIDQLMQRWEHRIMARNLRLAQRFLNLELHILLHLRVIETGVVWGVLLEKEVSTEPVGVEKVVMGEREQCSMLIDAVKFVDAPERIVPAFVWFEPIESLRELL
jgi:hypothetical protein